MVEIGKIVNVLSGPFSGQQGRVESIDGSSIEVEIEVFGRPTVLSFQEKELGEADQDWRESALQWLEEKGKRYKVSLEVKWWSHFAESRVLADRPLHHWKQWEASKNECYEPAEQLLKTLREKFQNQFNDDRVNDIGFEKLFDEWKRDRVFYDGQLKVLECSENDWHNFDRLREAARRAHLSQSFQFELKTWREKNLPLEFDLEVCRAKGRRSAELYKEPVSEHFYKTHQLKLPDHIFAFWAFWDGLHDIERKAWDRHLSVFPSGILDLLKFGSELDKVTAGIDDRLVYRYYRNPPEFVTVLMGDTDGLHWGLWYDDPKELPDRIVSTYARDSVEIGGNALTLFDVIQDRIVNLYEGLSYREEERADSNEAKMWLGHFEQLLSEYGEVSALERRESSDERIDSYDGLGVWVSERVFKRDPGEIVGIIRNKNKDALAERVKTARMACELGDPAYALALGRDLWTVSDHDEEREDLALSLLCQAYEALGRDALAAIARVHKEHRQITSVDSYRLPT